MSNSKSVPPDPKNVAQEDQAIDLSSTGLHSFILEPSNDSALQPSSDAVEVDAGTSSAIHELEVAPENQPLEERDA